MQESNNDPIFLEEQAHLSKLYRKLKRMEEIFEEEMRSINEKAAEEKRTNSEDVRFNFNNFEEFQEMLIEIETMSQGIAQLNISSQAVASRLRSVKRLLEKPYFARITIKDPEEKEAEDFYIGTTGISDRHHNPLVLDWRSPVAEVYYNHENGMTSYEVNGHKIPVELRLRRQFELERDILKGYFDTRVAMEDPLLIHTLSRKHSDKLKAITETIQKEQNTVIRYPDVPVLLINGIAGSGKTSILLQRIAFLFYRMRHSLRPNQVALITLNPVFRQYIDHVLPEMGEANPVTMTWSAFMELLDVRQQGEADMTELRSLYRIEEGLETLSLSERHLNSLRLKGERLLDKRQILSVIRSLRAKSVSPWLIQRVTEELLERAKKNTLKAAKKNEEYGITAEEDDEEPENLFTGILDRLREYGWLNFTALAQELLQREYVSAAEMAYLRLLLTGDCDRNTRYVIVDEVQDYTEAQLFVLTRYFRNAHFMFLGDEFQSLHNGTVRFSRIHRMFEKEGKAVTELCLNTSYRSSPEITALFTSLLPPEQSLNISSVQRPGIRPVIEGNLSKEQLKARLEAFVKEQETADGLSAILCQDWTGINRFAPILEPLSVQVIREQGKLPKRGVILLELKLAKGLEFDTVLLPDASLRDYPDKPLFRRRLYTAMSRATERLLLLSEGALSPLLSLSSEETQH